MNKQNHNNVSLAALAGVSEGVIRNLLKFGNDAKAKDPDARTLRKVADALNVNALYLFRLAGYIPPAPDAHSPRADLFADVFDKLTPENQEAVIGVLDAFSKEPVKHLFDLQLKDNANRELEGFELDTLFVLRTVANHLIAELNITEVSDLNRITDETVIPPNNRLWSTVPLRSKQRVVALIRHKLSLDYDPTMVDPEWRD